MKYQISIVGMHCEGCKNLISLSIKELGYSNVLVDLTSNVASFEINKPIEEVQNDLDKLFIEELNHYQYSNLNIIN